LFSFPLSKQQIQSLTINDIDSFSLLDKHGVLYGSNETFEQFKDRLINLYTDIENLYNSLKFKEHFMIHSNIRLSSANMIDISNFAVPCQITEKYSFSINWAPGFFAEKSIGFFAGGFTIVSDTGLPIFILKSNFKGKRKWLLYSLNELLSHELCHVARSPLADNHYEEFFAYKLSPSKFRNYFGSIFHSPIDSILMLIPIFLLLIVTLINTFYNTNINETYFWIISIIYPAFLFIRNFYYKRIFKKAYKSISKLVDKTFVEPILFRCTAHEIKTISRYQKLHTDDLLRHFKEYAHKSIRWKIILKRFISEF
jgi:hypothetical protein